MHTIIYRCKYIYKTYNIINTKTYINIYQVMHRYKDKDLHIDKHFNTAIHKYILQAPSHTHLHKQTVTQIHIKIYVHIHMHTDTHKHIYSNTQEIKKKH